jgi:hypothetical protein
MLSGFMSRKPVPTPPKVVRFVLAFNPNLTDPKATCLEVGEFSISGEKFKAFNWWLDFRALGLDPLTEGIFHIWPESMRHLVAQWPAFRNRPIPDHLKTHDPDNIEDYIIDTLERSSIFVARVEYGEIRGST